MAAPYPLGATVRGGGTNFAVHSGAADRVDLCLFDERGREERRPLTRELHGVHYDWFPDLGPGQRYGYRAHGVWNPRRGRFCNPAKLLLDPYARHIDGELAHHDAIHGHQLAHPERASRRDSAPFVPRSVVVDDRFDWQGDERPSTRFDLTVVYEAHVRGTTMRHPDVTPDLRGTYRGMATEPVIEHLTALGVTAVELLPVHHHVTEGFLRERGMTNYWGYNTLGYFAPHAGYATPGGCPVTEFKMMVRDLHRAGIEVFLDVVYNHTAEGNAMGPLLSLKGLDAEAYYRLAPGDHRHFVDYAGTGNTLDTTTAPTRRLIMDSLRYWVEEMHVDGFRFDLAPALFRSPDAFDHAAPLLAAIDQDPVLARVKLIAEPWDVGPDGYQLGRFPPPWAEWNGRYRDSVRDYWRGADETLADFASRLTGSSDLFGWSQRRPTASVNFVTSHDGFTLLDLVSYDHKHNEENGDDNRDGHDDNRSWNSGQEGPTDDPEIVAVRALRRRSLLATLFLSQGIPMILAGDEMGNTQCGNNNAYCQDNETSWLDWERPDRELLAFVQRLARFRAAHPIFRRRRWFEGQPVAPADIHDIGWFTPGGTEMAVEDWQTGYAKSLGVFFNGRAAARRSVATADPVPDESFLVMFNAHREPVMFRIPDGLGGDRWAVEIDTADATAREDRYVTNDNIDVAAWSTVVLRRLDERPAPRGER